MKKIIFIFCLLLHSHLWASTICHPYYEEKIRNLEKLIIPARGAFINSSAGAVISQPILLGLGLLTPAGAITVGATIVGSASYTLIIHRQIQQYKNILRLYAHRDLPQSKIYKRVFKKLNHNQIKMDSLLLEVRYGLESGSFCRYDEFKEKYALIRFQTLIKSQATSSKAFWSVIR